ncbi:MAG: pantoate--beta-alanine ligase, partial [Phycisphaerales bacterium]
MVEANTIARTREFLKPVRQQGRRIGFVPTMGALHEGHLSLIRASREAGDYTVVSIFVNPTQFGPGEDFNAYPRPIDEDRRLCSELGVDLLFLPDVKELYPRKGVVTVRPTRVSDRLCGAFRPGHFEGVITVVAKLFNIVQPDVAYFGQKDAQQALVIKKMAADLDMNINVVVLPTVRESDGLAMSSRNAYLNVQERKAALVLY